MDMLLNFFPQLNGGRLRVLLRPLAHIVLPFSWLLYV